MPLHTLTYAELRLITEGKIAEACNRLIRNSIVCWNYLYLEHKLATLRDAGQNQMLEEIAQTAGSLRALAEMLERHPEAVLRGRGA